LGIFDPAHVLDECGEWLDGVPRLNSYSDLKQFDLLLAVGWDAQILEYLAGGGRILLLQQGIGPLPSRRMPFWREAIKLFEPHPVWEVFPQRGYTDLQFFGLAGDLAFDTGQFTEALPGLREVKPILRRLDGRAFHMTDYLVETRVGAGFLVACALRLQGGAGAQPFGWQQNPAGGFMLSTLCTYLQHAQGNGV
jgi:hypothetical protein